VTISSGVTNVTVWLITSNPNPRVLKIEKWKINQKENKIRKENKEKLSLHFLILTILVNAFFVPMFFTISEIRGKE